MENWDEDDVAVAMKLKANWDDEPIDIIPESWEAISESKPAPTGQATVKTKASVGDRIKKKDEERRRNKEERTKEPEQDSQSDAQHMTELQRQRLAEESEWKLLADTLGSQPTDPAEFLNGIDTYEPRTKEEFNKFNQILRDKLLKFEKSPHFPAFIEQLLRDTIAEMDIESIRSISTTVTTMMSEKQKSLKGKTKKKSKGKLVVERDLDFGDGDEAALQADDYDDFL